MRLIKSLILPIVAALVVAGVGYQVASHGSRGSKSSSVATVTGHHASVKIVNFGFSPATLTVKVGTRVTWANHDSTAHTATADGGSFDTGSLGQGKRVTITFNKVGTFTYHCTFHAFMTGTVEVVS